MRDEAEFKKLTLWTWEAQQGEGGSATMRSLRATGRTTRMLEEAIRQDKQGRAVYVMAATHFQADWIKRKLLDMTKGKPGGIKVEHPRSMNFDWDRMLMPGAHANCVILVDHFAIEDRFSKIIDALHRFDPPVTAEAEETTATE